jgi:hypothetical protein
MSMRVVFKVTRAANSIPAGTEVQCLMRACVKEGNMKVTVINTGAEVELPRSRLAWVRYVRKGETANSPAPEMATSETPAQTVVAPAVVEEQAAAALGDEVSAA